MDPQVYATIAKHLHNAYNEAEAESPEKLSKLVRAVRDVAKLYQENDPSFDRAAFAIAFVVGDDYCEQIQSKVSA